VCGGVKQEQLGIQSREDNSILFSRIGGGRAYEWYFVLASAFQGSVRVV